MSQLAFDLISPRSGTKIGSVHESSEEDVTSSITSASQSFPAWSNLSEAERADYLDRVADCLRGEIESLVEAEMAETGQSRENVMGAVSAGIDNWSHFADVIRAGFQKQKLDSGGEVFRRPLGPSAVIVPWNYPLLIAFRFIPGMLAVGNTVIWKPSEKTPLSAIEAMRVLDGVLPPGVLSCVVGAAEVGKRLVESDAIKLLAFTGSTKTGTYVARESANRLRPVLLELGGKDAVIVDSGVDVEWAARLVAEGGLTNTGQICTSMERVIVHKDIHQEFVDALVAEVKATWNFDYEGGKLGPMIDEGQRKLVHSHVQDALEKGAEALVGGYIPEGDGVYYPATVMTKVDESSTILVEETFGPVLPISVAESQEVMRALAENSLYGLGLTVLSNDPGFIELMKSSSVSTVWVNAWHTYSDDAIHQPSGQSGTGAIGWRGKNFLDAVSAPTFVSAG